MTLSPGQLVENFTIEKCLSERGGMSKIYLAYETKRPSRYVAMKIQLTGQPESVMYQDLLRQEAALLKTIRHPGIVRILPIRIDDMALYVAKAIELSGAPWYYTMEYLGEWTLESHLKNFPTNINEQEMEKTVFSIDWSIEMFYQILTVINFMHEQGIAHCDLKPENIMFRHEPSVTLLPQPILIDFGSASQFKNMKQLTASPGYSPPEVMEAVKLKQGIEEAKNIYPQKIDIWSLGAIFFELLTGHPMNPVKKGFGISFLEKALSFDQPKTIKDYRPEIHDSLEKLLQVMVNPDPQKRPKVSQIIKALEEKIFSVRPPRINNRITQK
ncbi:MAG: serine/threonine-protein kinase [Chloroflexota bacterium]